MALSFVLAACGSPQAEGPPLIDPANSVTEGVVVTAVHASPAEGSEIRWSGRCDDQPFSISWAGPPDTLTVQMARGTRVYSEDEPFMRALFYSGAPLMLYRTCDPRTDDLRVYVLSVRRFDDMLRLVRGNLSFDPEGGLVYFDGPFEESLLSLPHEFGED